MAGVPCSGNGYPRSGIGDNPKYYIPDPIPMRNLVMRSDHKMDRIFPNWNDPNARAFGPRHDQRIRTAKQKALEVGFAVATGVAGTAAVSGVKRLGGYAQDVLNAKVSSTVARKYLREQESPDELNEPYVPPASHPTFNLPYTAAPLEAPTKMPKRTREEMEKNKEVAIAKSIVREELRKQGRYNFPHPKAGPSFAAKSGAEVKACDQLQNSTLFAQAGATASCTYLNIIESGSAFYNRIGAKIAMKSLYIHGFVDFSDVTKVAQIPFSYRIVIAYDRSPNGTQCQFGDVFQDRNLTGSTGVSTHSGINLDNRARFKVFHDVRYVFGGQTVGTNPPAVEGSTLGNLYNCSPNVLPLSAFIPLKKYETVFKASTASSGDITTGALVLFLVMDAAPATTTLRLNWNCRLRFWDV